MQICRTVKEMREFVQAEKQQGRTVALVPTMGYLHQGHAALMQAALQACQTVVASVFVNPIQFCPGEDLETYPRNFGRDCQLLESLGVQAVFHPEPAEMYAENFSTYVEPGGLTDCLCGKSRPGHFRGVATVVTKLFNIVQPDQAFFGQKDAQQVLVLKRMVRDLNIPVQINVVPIVREADGLAVSSRNTYLSLTERSQAVILHKSILAAEAAVQNGERNCAEIVRLVKAKLAAVPEAQPEYVEIRNQNLEEAVVLEGACLLAMAVRFGTTRLIDNTWLEV
ncbi:MAG: pantoate--beta-alanine ligase [Clostridia bacterium]|nr:pantoate--beta-alanine ligase [Clostridia bacterium]